MATLGIPQNTIAVLQKYNFTFQKKYGQNFLIDSHVLEKIMDAAEIGKDDCVVEIGPGIGTMTQYLAERAGEVVAVEIDKNLIPILTETLADYKNVSIINEDILEPVVGWTTHHSICEYKGQWYLFHHDCVPSNDTTWLRSVKVAPLFYDEEGNILPVK